MRERNLVMARIREKEAEIQSLQGKLAEAGAYLQALKDVIDLLPGSDDPSDASILKPGSAVAAAREAILGAGRPMHIDELLKAAGKASTREAKVSLSSALSAYVRRQEIFTRPAMSTFGLIEMQHFSESAAEAFAEPPPGFGIFAGDVDREAAE
jgi:hypothetical protein